MRPDEVITEGGVREDGRGNAYSANNILWAFNMGQALKVGARYRDVYP